MDIFKYFFLVVMIWMYNFKNLFFKMMVNFYNKIILYNLLFWCRLVKILKMRIKV